MGAISLPHERKMQTRVALLMLVISIAVNALPSDQSKASPQPKDIGMKHVHDKVHALKTTHTASPHTSAKLAEATALMAVVSASATTDEQPSNGTAITNALNTAINAIDSDLSTGHSTDST